MNYIAVIQDELNSILRGLVESLPNLVIALVVLAITWLVARFAASIADRLTDRTNMRASLQKLVETMVRLAIRLIGIMIALTIALPGLDPGGLVAGLGIGALAIGFAFQDIFENFLAGVLIMLREKMRLGDVIEVEGILGKVENITLRETHIRQLSNELTILPNSMLFKNPVKIITDEAVRRDEIMVGVAYDTDLAQAEQAIRTAVESCEAVDHDRPIGVFAREFGGSSIDFLVQWWTETSPRDMRATRTDVLYAIKRELDAAGIEIPFPYVTHTFAEPVPLAQKTRDAA